VIKAVILCGGKGTRLREETEYRPKPLVPIGGRPILWHIMKRYSMYHLTNFVLCLGYRGEMIKEYFLNYDLLNSDFTIDLGTKCVTRNYVAHDELDWRVSLVDTGQETMTGGRVARIRSYVENDEAFMLTYGDGVADVDLGALLAFHREQRKLVTVTGVHPKGRFGELAVRGDSVTSFSEKPPANENWINGGFFVCSPGVFDYLSGDECILEREPLERLAADGELAVYRHDGYWQCMDTPRDMETLNQEWASGSPAWMRGEQRSPAALLSA
jgi:glucose-1-phosphate cytidylyltransferase